VTAVLERYGNRSPHFMAARFDASRVLASSFRSGDGIPIHLELPLDQPWVPPSLLDDLRSDKNSTWVPDSAYLTHVSINTPAVKLKRDLVPVVAPIPQAPQQAEPPTPAATRVMWTITAGLGGVRLGAIAMAAMAMRQKSPHGAK
jgi:hypothetical protein